MSTKYVYAFSEGDATMKNLLGGKGANLAEMTNIGIHVPQGFTITTEACNYYRRTTGGIPSEIWDQVKKAVKTLEKETGKGFGDDFL